MKFRSVFLTLCAALISVSLVSCGGNMDQNNSNGAGTSANSGTDSTKRAETTDTASNSTDSDILPGSDTGNARRGMDIRMQDFSDGVEENRQ